MKKYFSLLLALVMLVTAIPFASLTASAAAPTGDGNGDGQVTAMDARLALRYVAGLEDLTDNQIKALDLDGNAKISAIDARMILREVAGLSNDIETDSEQMRSILRLFGYEYDEEQNVYYTSLNAWQRNFGFTDLYDNAAAYATMLYQTLKIDFEYEGLLWRLQWWKGQYGVLEGAEMGVYTKKPENKDFPFYKCAEDENLLEMYFEYYQTPADYNAGKPLFTRYEQEHWWITGFKFGVCNPDRNVLKAVLIARDTKMADGIEEGLKNVTDKNGKVNGFVEYRPWHNIETSNFYTRTKLEDGRIRFDVVWKDAGYKNYGGASNNVEEDPVCTHDQTEEVVTQPTETTSGLRVVKCAICGVVIESEAIPPTGTSTETPETPSTDTPVETPETPATDDGETEATE